MIEHSRRTQSGLRAALFVLAASAFLVAIGAAEPSNAVASGGPQPVVSVSATFTAPDADHVSVLYIQAKIQPGWHIYSVTQPDGGPVRSSVNLPGDQEILPLGKVRSWPKPVVKTESAFKDLPIETHEEEVTWYLPISIPAGADLKEFKIEGSVTAQACNDNGCQPPKKFKFSATSGKAPKLPPEADSPSPLKQPAKAASGNAGKSKTLGEIRQPGSHTTIQGHFEPSTAAAGGSIKLVLTAIPEKPYHVYALEASDSRQGAYKPTLIRLDLPPGWRSGSPQPDHPPIEKEPESSGDGVQHYYEDAVRWTIELQVPSDASGEVAIGGVIGYQSCFEQTGCDRPLGAHFAGVVAVESAARGGEAPLSFTPAKYKDASAGPAAASVAENDEAAGATAATSDGVNVDDLNFELSVVGDAELAQMPVFKAIVLGFLGGVLLNLMPCVLPVIGLKILTFVEQSGHSRARIIELNVWYSLGLIAVFMVLATLAVAFGLGWGELFKYREFNIALATVVFAMSLSFLGIWEIPIPGFVGSGKSGELAAQEGAPGAFAKGVITTVLATPCTGPFLTSAFVWAAAKPAPLVYTLFFSIGLGMASPYLAIGVFPRLIRWLPKPGAWMETFKQMMGFVLLGTVVYLLTVIPEENLISTVALLFGTWAACWWIGRHQWTNGGRSKLVAWVQGTVFACAVGWFAFTWLIRSDQVFWQPFTIKEFKELVRDEKTVVVDFTAPWCLTCKTLEKTVLNTGSVRELIRKNDVRALQAQWLDEFPDTGLMLEKLKSEQIPVVAIFPAGNWTKPIVLRGLFSRQAMLTALEQAGPSKSTEGIASTASAVGVVP